MNIELRKGLKCQFLGTVLVQFPDLWGCTSLRTSAERPLDGRCRYIVPPCCPHHHQRRHDYGHINRNGHGNLGQVGIIYDLACLFTSRVDFFIELLLELPQQDDRKLLDYPRLVEGPDYRHHSLRRIPIPTTS
jgi:hypothetical protein